MSWVKGDGAAIKITFDKALLGDVSGNQSHFTVTAKEYNWVPNGTLQSVSKTVLSTAAGATAKEVVLNMADLARFESAVELTVTYDGLGTLAGTTGNVEAFTQIFIPQGLVSKPDQNPMEHIEVISTVITASLLRIYTTDTFPQDTGHIEVTGVTAIAILTHVNDL